MIDQLQSDPVTYFTLCKHLSGDGEGLLIGSRGVYLVRGCGGMGLGVVGSRIFTTILANFNSRSSLHF